MKKMILFVLLSILILTTSGCSTNNPFKKLSGDYVSYHTKMQVYATYGSNNTREAVTADTFYEKTVSGALSYTYGSAMGEKFKAYSYEDETGIRTFTYNYKTNSYKESFQPAAQEDIQLENYMEKLFMEENYDYNKKDKKYYIKNHVDLGLFSDAVIYIQDKKVCLECKATEVVDYETYNFKMYVTYDQFDEDFNIELPKSN